MTGPIQVPVFLSGIVVKAPDVSFCMDGAKYVLRHQPGSSEIRLVAANRDVDSFLSKVVDTRQRVAVAGYMVYGPECNHLSVYWAGPADQLFQEITTTQPGPALQSARGPILPRQDYTGESRKGNLQEALQNAIDSVPEIGSDMLVTWHVKEISGQRGGIAGLKVVQVTVSANA